MIVKSKIIRRGGQKLKIRRGFSLIEVIISLALILVTLIIFGVALSTTPLTKTARNQNLAYHIAAKKIEELRNTSFASLPGSGTFSDPGLLELASSTASLTISNYQGSSQIKNVIVIVSWYEEQTARQARLETLISEGGLSKP